MFYKCVDIHSVANTIGENIFSICIWNVVNQLDRYDFSFVSVVNKLKEMQHFSNGINGNCFDLSFAWCYWNCSTIEYPRCRNSAINGIISSKVEQQKKASLKQNLNPVRKINIILHEPNKRKIGLPCYE